MSRSDDDAGDVRVTVDDHFTYSGYYGARPDLSIGYWEYADWYPIDEETASAVAASWRRGIVSWADLKSCCIRYWVLSHYIDLGRIKVLPYRVPDDAGVNDFPFLGNCEECSDGPPMGTFPYLYDMRGVSPKEIDEAETGVQREILHLAESGRVRVEKQLNLEPFVPVKNRWLSRPPILKGKWIGCYHIELAETTSLLENRGYTRHESPDTHSLAWEWFYSPGDDNSAGVRLDEWSIESVREEVKVHLHRCPGRKVTIGECKYLSFEDYCNWSQRFLKADLRSPAVLEEGLAVRSWNTWFKEQRRRTSEVRLNGVEVTSIPPPPDLHCDCMIDGDKKRQVEWVRLRNKVLESEMSDAQEPFVPNPRQEKILAALDGRARRSDDLAKQVGCDKRQLYRSTGLSGLIEAGLVDHHQKIGYYRPDALPRGYEQYLSPRSDQ